MYRVILNSLNQTNIMGDVTFKLILPVVYKTYSNSVSQRSFNDDDPNPQIILNEYYIVTLL